MSDAKDEVPQEKGAEPEEGYSKQKIIIFYSLTVGIVILVVIVALILAIKFDDPMPEGLILKYTSDDAEKVTLFSSDLKDSISSLTIDGVKVETISNEHTFEKKGEHEVQVALNKDLETMKELFSGCTNLVEVDFSQINTEKVKSMEALFKGCSKLTAVTITDTSSVESMKEMFSSCTSLTEVNLDYFVTSKVTDMSKMFSGSALTSLDLSSFNTSLLDDMSSMFYDMKDITTLDLQKFDTKNVKNMNNAFSKCPKLSKLDIRKFSSSKLESKENIFADVAVNGTITYNPELFKDECFEGSNVENWEKTTVTSS